MKSEIHFDFREKKVCRNRKFLEIAKIVEIGYTNADQSRWTIEKISRRGRSYVLFSRLLIQFNY